MVAVSGSMFPMGIAPNDSARVYESPDESARRVGATVQVVDYDFLDTLAIDMVAGRAFSREFGDDVSDAARPTAGNIIVDEAMVERMGWASTQAAIGKTLYVPGLANGIGHQANRIDGRGCCAEQGDVRARLRQWRSDLSACAEAHRLPAGAHLARTTGRGARRTGGGMESPRPRHRAGGRAAR